MDENMEGYSRYSPDKPSHSLRSVEQETEHFTDIKIKKECSDEDGNVHVDHENIVDNDESQLDAKMEQPSWFLSNHKVENGERECVDEISHEQGEQYQENPESNIDTVPVKKECDDYNQDLFDSDTNGNTSENTSGNTSGTTDMNPGILRDGNHVSLLDSIRKQLQPETDCVLPDEHNGMQNRLSLPEEDGPTDKPFCSPDTWLASTSLDAEKRFTAIKSNVIDDKGQRVKQLIDGKKLNKCEICEKTFTRRHRLNKHVIAHANKKPYECRECVDEAVKRGNTSHHLTHAGEKSHPCHECGRTFTRHSILKMHMLTHTGEKPHICKECGEQFAYIGNLNAHILTHSGHKPHKCEECGRTFSRRNLLARHVLTHKGELPFECPDCDKAFGIYSQFRTHILIHTGQEPHECKECGKKFSYPSSLKKHLLIHTKERPYTCKECKKSFSQVSHLNRHIRSHTGEKPFACDQCEKRYTKKVNLAKHKLTHTRVKPGEEVQAV